MINHAITVGDVLAAWGVGMLIVILALAIGCYGLSRSWW